jgi:hypothetical protein
MNTQPAYVNIMEVAPKQVKNPEGLCVCDKCTNTFEAKNALMEATNNIEFQGILGIKGVTKGKKTYYLVSPCCKEVHLFGFDIKPNLTTF